MKSIAGYDSESEGDKKRKHDQKKKHKKRKEDEIDYWKRKHSDLKETMYTVQRRNRKLEEKLDDLEHGKDLVYASFKEKEEECHELEAKLSDLYEKCFQAEQDFKQFEHLINSKHSAQIDEYKKMCSEMHDKVRRLEEEGKSGVVERGTAEREQIVSLEKQAMYRLKYEIQLEKRLDGYRTKYKELCMRYKEKKEKMGCLEKEVEENKGMCVRLNERIASLEKDWKVKCEGEKRAQVRISYLEKLLGKRVKSDESEAKLQHLGLDEENSTTRCSVGSRDHGERECAQRGSHNGFYCNDKGENDVYERLRSEMNGGTHEAHVASSTFKEKMMNNAEKILLSAFQDNNNSSSQGNKDAHVSGTVEICDNKDENISPQRKCHSGVREGLQVSSGNRIERCLRKPLSDQKEEAYDSGSEKDDTPLSSTAKRRRYSKGLSSDSEEDDPTLLGELQEKVFEELTVIPKLKLSPTNPCAWNSSNVSISTGGHNVDEFLSPSHQRQGSPTKHEVKMSQVDETLKNVKDILASNNLEMSLSPAQVKIGTVEICDNKDENISPQRKCHSAVREGLQVSTGNRIERCLRKPLSDQKEEAYGGVYEKDDTPLSSTAKRRRYSKSLSSDSEEDDPTLLGELQEKVFEEVTVSPKLKLSPTNPCAWNSSNVSVSGGHNVDEFVSPLSQRQVSPIKHGEKKSQVDETLKNVKDILASNNLEMSLSSAQVRIGNLTSENNNSTSQRNKDAHVSGICHSGVKEGLQVSTGNRIERCLRKPFSDQKGEVYDSGSEKDDTPLSSTAKRRRYLKIVTSNDEEDDPTIIGELQEKVFEKLTVIPPMDLCAWNSSNVSLFSGGENVGEFGSPSRQRQASPRKHEETKSQVDETLKNVEDILASNNLEMSVSSEQVKIGNLTSENDEEKVAQEAGSESEAGSCSDSEDSSSDAEDAVYNGLDFGQAIAMMRSNKNKETKWQNEEDMLSSFEKDPVLCMKAVCALHRQQTDEAKSIKGPFSLFSALSGSDLAEFLMDGNPDGDLKKSVEELEMFDPEGLEDCKTLATHYAKQLFSIYQNEKDLFSNSS